MGKPAVRASLEDFARTGRIGPIDLGSTREQLLEVLGLPQDWQNGKSVDRSLIWKYGDAELYFRKEDDRLCLIHFDWFDVPVGSPALVLDPWVIRHGLAAEALQTALDQAGISFKTEADPVNPDCVNVTTAAGVLFLVQIEGSADEVGLRVFGRTLS